MMKEKIVIVSKVLFLLLFVSASCHRIKDSNPIEEHINNPEHDASVDHEAFLGVEESKNFDKLSPEESKSRLKKIILTKVDVDGDKIVSQEELREWIFNISRLSKEKERNEAFPIFSNSSDELLDYDTYFNKIYGGLTIEQLDEVSKENLAIMKMQDDRKWKLVDENHDNKLDKDEFLVFLHPEDYQKMRPLIVQETMEVSDKNKDGFLDLQEYLSDIWPVHADQPDAHLLKQEEDTFANYRDKNNDNKLDLEEVGEWLMPTGYDSIDAETKHLMHNADTNEDGQLTVDEILNSYDTFVGSQATDYGNTLKHDEF